MTARPEGQVSVDGPIPTDEPMPQWQSVMVDVSGLSLTELATEGDDVLAHCCPASPRRGSTDGRSPVAAG
jgi:hypothetical protein